MEKINRKKFLKMKITEKTYPKAIQNIIRTLYDRARHSLMQTKLLVAKVRSSMSNIGLFINTVVHMFVVAVIN